MINDKLKEQKRAEILQKCFELFVKKGLENTSLNELASYCNTHKVTLYTYLNSKDEIVIECAKMYMEKLDKKFFNTLTKPERSLKAALQSGFNVIKKEKTKFRYIYQVISSPKYGEESRRELYQIYMKYMDYSYQLSELYNVEHKEFRPYFLLFIATIHDFCLWENETLVNEKLKCIYDKLDALS